MRALFTKLGRGVLWLFALVARVQAWVLTKLCPLIPGWKFIEAFCAKLLRPVVALGGFLQRRVPGVRSFEWLLEIDGLKARHPVLLVFALTMVFLRGMQTTQYGHIGTDALIYPLLGGLSYLNPFLGLVAAIAFGAGDLLQKLVNNDMYGTGGTGDYVGALFGYVIAYSALAAMGLAPGMLSRVFSLVVRKIMQAVFFREAARVADGAPEDISQKGGMRAVSLGGIDGGLPSAGRLIDDGSRTGIVPSGAWKSALDVGHPIDPEWKQFLDTRAAGEVAADTFERLQIPPQGLRSAIEQGAITPDGWSNLCTLTGTPVEPWMSQPGAQPPGGAARWLAEHALPAGPPVPTASDWLAQNAMSAAADADAAALAAARRARALHQAEDLEMRRTLDAARERGQLERVALQEQMGAVGSARFAGSVMPMPRGGPPDVAFVLPELLASMLGAAVGSWGVVNYVAPAAEWPAFYLRPNADVSCYRAEVTGLAETAQTSAATVPAIGPAATAFIPPVVPPGPGAPGGAPPLQPGIDPDALKDVIATRDYHQSNANRLRQDLATATDPRVREELTRRLEATEANVAAANDEIHRAQTGQYQRTRTAWDDRQDKIQAEQSAAMAADLKAKAEAREAAAKQAAADERRPEWRAEQDRLEKEAARMAAQTGLGWILTQAFTGSVKEVVQTGSDAVSWTGKTLGAGWDAAKRVARDPVGSAKSALNTTYEAAAAGAKYVADGANEIWRDVKDGRTWEIVKGTAAGSALTVGKAVGTTGQAIYQTFTDPKKMLAAVKDALGGNDFEKSWDPNVPLSQRLGHVGIGVMKLYGTLATAGQVGTAVKSGLNTLGKSQFVGKVKAGMKSAIGLTDDAARAAGPKVFPPRPAKFVPGIDKQVSLSPGTNIKPQLKGMTDPGMKHVQMVADKHGARIAVRPSNPYSKALIEQGAHPKPAWQKMKTINDTDTALGAHIDSRGKVGLFKPKLPDEKLYDPKKFAKIKERYEDRLKEWKTYGDDFKQMELDGKIKIREGAIHAPDGTPYAGDYDVFQVTGANGEKLPDAVRDRIIKELQQPPFNAQHGAHLDWATTSAKEAGMKVKIASSHAAVVPAKIENGVVVKPPHPGEPLITAIGGETERAGAAGGRLVGSHYNIPPDAGGVL